VILRAVRSSSAPEHWYGAIRAMESGDPFPLHARRKEGSSGRDIQFECFIAAICALGGYAVEFTEPDVRVSGFGHEFLIAAKRPRTEGSVEKNFRKAQRQIDRAGGRGLVALDVSEVLHHGQLFRSRTDRDAADLARASADRFLKSRQRQFLRIVAGRTTVGALMSLHVPVQTYTAEGKKRVATAIRWAVTSFVPPATDQDHRDVEEFAHRCESGLFGPRKTGSGEASTETVGRSSG